LRRRGSEIITILPTARSQHDVAMLRADRPCPVPGLLSPVQGHESDAARVFSIAFLAHRAARAIKIGIAFSFQIVDRYRSTGTTLDLISW